MHGPIAPFVLVLLCFRLMFSPRHHRLPLLGLFALGFFALGLVGCDSPITRFPSNQLYSVVVAKREALDAIPPAEIANVEAAVTEMFGTPEEPRLPPEIEPSLATLDNLKRAAGAVWSDQAGVQFGLYREHCATCHGVDGSGAGPAASLLNPYPRDFRAGVFKFKSTQRTDKPTHGDMLTLLRRGIPGTAMPSFARVSDEDLEAIVQYVRYLSIRGETERKLIEGVAAEELSAEQMTTVANELVAEIAKRWSDAESSVVAVSTKPSDAGELAWWQDPQRIERGREMFHGPLANCASCHGPGGDGNATTLDFDDWTKEYTTKLSISPSDRVAVKAMQKVGALRPRQSLPRKLQWSVYHGDDSDEALYRRLVIGIAGTPMPGLLLQATNAEQETSTGATVRSTAGVTGEDVWALVAYLRSLADGP
jgi:mono/diheme cytochrome c family protein